MVGRLGGIRIEQCLKKKNARRESRVARLQVIVPRDGHSVTLEGIQGKPARNSRNIDLFVQEEYFRMSHGKSGQW